MADDKSPLVRDILISDAIMHNSNEDSLPHIDFMDTDIHTDDEPIASPFDIFSLNYIKEDEIITETMFIDQCFSNSSFDLPHTSAILSSSPSVYNNFPQHDVSNCSISFDSYYHSCFSISFSNPPEPIYHVRYLSEITNSPLDGTHGRHVTIDLPMNLPDSNEFFIRVTRLTVPYQNLSFIHPYPLLYSPPKKKIHADVIIKPPSIYYKLNKEEICSHSKQFPNIILTRLKQCNLKVMNNLDLFDNYGIVYPFIGNNAKNKIANYQLKKSQLDFRLVFRCHQTDEFIDLNVSCRSDELLEEEGTECKKLLISSSL
ncbi:unnamed protein product [Adineta steineri]|uniref:Uncharacterized protein n=1 Tax=Adineta steineri TaxID=433720 RepID=A0A818NQR8_9BILA|nr:unnamed protein product [Adineta steineri]